MTPLPLTGLEFVSSTVAVSVVVPSGLTVAGAAFIDTPVGNPATKVTLVPLLKPLAEAVISAIPTEVPLVNVTSAMPLLFVVTEPAGVNDPNEVEKSTAIEGTTAPEESRTTARTKTESTPSAVIAVAPVKILMD